MKTIEQWLNELESPYREQALENMTNNAKNDPELYHDLEDALYGAFYWAHTPEGYDYWDKLIGSL